MLPVGLWAQYSMTVTREPLTKLSDSELNTPAPTMTDAQRQALAEAYYARREAMDAANNQKPESSLEQESVPAGREAQFDDQFLDGDFHAPPGFLPSSRYIGRNNINTRANLAGFGSTLAETSAVNEGPNIFYTGNNHAEFSINGGVGYVNAGIPAGPAAAPFPCCDNDSVYDKGRGVTIWSTLYLNAASTTGVVGIFIRRHIPFPNNCAYTYTPGAGTVPDYPHLALSNDFLYLTTNNGATHRIIRLGLDALVDCAAAAAVPTVNIGITPAVGQRVVVGVEGATDTMYWAYHESAIALRIWHWPETLPAPLSVLKPVTAHNHVNPICKGGANNTDWIERSTSFTITGFRMRGAVGGGKLGFWWNATPDAIVGHTQAHIHAAVFRDIAGLAFPLLGQPHIFSPTRCLAYPAVGVNERGDFGFIVGRGGNNPGGVAIEPVRPYWGIDDDYTAGAGVVDLFTLFASGTHNPGGAPPRWGDYHSVRRQQPCGMAWSGTGYAHNGGTGVANINARYIEFMRGRDYQCYVQWRDEIPDAP
jgi:hypothetical protein